MSLPKAIALGSAASNSGKTTITLGLLRHLSQLGFSVRGAKSGPDYIDTMYHLHSCGRESVNLDAWSMGAPLIRSLAFRGVNSLTSSTAQREGDLVIIEGAMGALDGAGSTGNGSLSDLVDMLQIPLIMIVDATKSGHSCILPVLGLRTARPDINLAGFIANRVLSDRHERQIRTAASQYDLRLFGVIRNDPALVLPSRHLGLVPASEHQGISKFLNEAASSVSSSIDIQTILKTAGELSSENDNLVSTGIPPLGQHIAIARDDAFCFCYAHLLNDWRHRGAEISYFSPLANEPPSSNADAIYLPGGYPELHAPRLAAADQFIIAMKSAAQRSVLIYGECGGFMVLGQELQDKDGVSYPMIGLLSHSTSFKKPQLHLGYRRLKSANHQLLSGQFAGHEFHYSSLINKGDDNSLFLAHDADGNILEDMGGVRNSVSGSFAHLICSCESE